MLLGITASGNSRSRGIFEGEVRAESHEMFTAALLK